MKKKIIPEILLHILFWVLTFYFFTTTSLLRLPSLDINEEYISLGLIISLIYTNDFWFIPRFFTRKKFIFYFLFLISFLLIITTLEFSLLQDDLIKMTANIDNEMRNLAMRWNYFGIFFRNVLFVGFFTMFRIYHDAIKANKLLHEVMVLEKQKMRSEINRVKSKINSHFFFNTLNSIYAMALSKSDATADTIVNLSELMRYVVADSENEWVRLDQEIEFIRNYMALETIRHQKLDVSFDIKGETAPIKVPPMIFESFVNNAYKYTDNEGRGYIHVKLECLQDHSIVFSCENNTRSTTNTSIPSTGKGLKNTSDRLQLLYPQKHQLDGGLENGIYKVRLKLNALNAQK